MVRLRLFRILVPCLLIALGVAVVYSLNPPSRVHREVSGAPVEPEAASLAFEEWIGDLRTVTGSAARVQDLADGSLRLEGIRDLQITRADGQAVVISAERGEGEGPEGARRWEFEEEVTFFDPDSQLRLTLPVLQLDQAAGEARSNGDIRFSAPGMEGTVSGVVYGLRGQPGQLTAPVLRDDAGGRLVADSATLWESFDDIELVGHVRAEQPDGWIEAERLRVKRDEQGRLRTAVGRGAVRARWSLAPFVNGDLAGDELEVAFGEDGRVERARLNGDAVVRRGTDSLVAPTVEVVLREDGSGWSVTAQETVTVNGMFPGGAGVLRAERIDADLDSVAGLSRATALGRVVFEGPAMRAEGERGDYDRGLDGGQVRLYGEGRHKAHMAQGQTRVSAASIATDVGGQDLRASGSVEATLLPRRSATETGGGGVFRAGEAVLFVADELHSEKSGARLEFRGAVRGWQGDRNLAASRVVLTQNPNTLVAEGDVASRFPRTPEVGAIGEGDFVLINSSRFEYSEARSMGLYEGEVRMRFAEGRLTSGRLEVQIEPASRAILEARAFDQVALEIHASAKGEMDEPVAGRADRLVYHPAEAVLRLIGDAAPAEVRRAGKGGTTSGRVLLYRLDQGTYELDSGREGPATIRVPPEATTAAESR